MRRLFAGIAFLSRIPVPGAASFDAADVGRATLLFPVVGALLGGVLVLARQVLFPALPPLVAAFLLLAVGTLLTGALHLDGLADMADGFGGGHTKEDVLRIMRDHLIGAYGAVALVLCLGLKASALAALLERGHADVPLVVAPALGRWASVFLGRFLPYARRSGGLGSAITDHVGWLELSGATLLTVGLVGGLLGWRGGVILAGVTALTAIQGAWCVQRIGGITGDTMGANTEVCETLVFVVLLGLGEG